MDSRQGRSAVAVTVIRERAVPDRIRISARMRQTVFAAALLSLLLVGSGCATSTLRTAGGFREQNRSNLQRLKIGMARDEVLSIMGTESLPHPAGTEGSGALRTEQDTLGVTQVQVPLGARAPALYNPMRSATLEAGGASWEVLYYYVRMVEDDDRVTDDELDPVVLKNGYLAGTGWSYWRRTAASEGITLTRDTAP